MGFIGKSQLFVLGYQENVLMSTSCYAVTQKMKGFEETLQNVFHVVADEKCFFLSVLLRFISTAY